MGLDHEALPHETAAVDCRHPLEISFDCALAVGVGTGLWEPHQKRAAGSRAEMVEIFLAPCHATGNRGYYRTAAAETAVQGKTALDACSVHEAAPTRLACASATLQLASRVHLDWMASADKVACEAVAWAVLVAASVATVAASSPRKAQPTTVAAVARKAQL